MCCMKAKSAFEAGARRPNSANRSSLSKTLLADHFAEKGGGCNDGLKGHAFMLGKFERVFLCDIKFAVGGVIN